MIQFTEAEISHLKAKGALYPEVVERLRQDVQAVMAEDILVPETGIGNWSLYYFCPECSVRLTFNRHDRHHHKCPSCQQILTGEPYDSTWWGLVNSRNYTAAFSMGLLYLITGESDYARKAIGIMMEYAKYYQDYEVHGDIPYNGPGKAGAQTLDEANFLRTYAMTYDLLSEVMTEAEQTMIRDCILLPGAAFLMAHRHQQLHNHEVITNSAIAIIGLLFGIDDYIQTAVYEPYGLLYQLEKGMLHNHMWFEGAFGYHYYALTSFFAYEKFALHTDHSHIHHPNYKAMMELLVEYLEPGFRIPMLNDTNYGHTSGSFYLYEFAYRELGGERLLYILNEFYKTESRTNLEALIYGVDTLPECSTRISLENYHDAVGSYGNTIIRGANDRYLLIKHDSYGGEHDHYDRLDISYLAYGRRIAPDLGTTGYGAKMHYDYYKNTGSHNTITIGGENQAPVNGRLNRFEEKDGCVWVEVEADWTAPYEMPDSFTIVQWNEEYYKTVKMNRKIIWTDEFFIEKFTVRGVAPELSIDWVMHFSGELTAAPAGQPVACFATQKPYKYLHTMNCTKAVSQTSVTAYHDDGITTHVYGAGIGQDLFVGRGPDNPSVSDINYRIERCFGGAAEFVHVITSSDGPCKISAVDFEQLDQAVLVTVVKADDTKQSFQL